MAYQGEKNAPGSSSPPVGGWLQGWLCKAVGLAMLAGCVAVGVSLVTWSITDPSFSRATSAVTRNALGPVGAIVSDLLMQTLGMAAVLFVLPPLFWSLQMMTQGRLDRPRPKLLMAPAALLLLAGAISSLPQIPDWPMSHGLGGFLGDKMLNVAASILGFINPARAYAAAGFFYFAGGLMLLINSLGLTQQDIRMIFDIDLRAGFCRIALWGRELRDVLQARGEPMLQPTAAASATSYAAAPAEIRAEPSFGFDPPPRAPAMPASPPHHAQPHIQMRAPEPQPAYAPAAHRPSLRQEPVLPEPVVRPEPMLPEPLPAPHHVAHEPAHDEAYLGTHRAHEPSFDHVTDLESLKIARRFAPGGMDMMLLDLPMGAIEIDPTVNEPVMPTVPVAPPPPPAPKEKPYRRPSVQLLRRPVNVKPGADLAPQALQERARQLTEVLSDFGVRGEVKEVSPGPVVTLFEFEPARGVKSARVINLAEDISRAMTAQSVRVAVVPGRNAIGIELPNQKRETVCLRELLETEAFQQSDAALPLVLGKTISGTPVFSDLARMPHLLVAGTTGSGKSVGVNAMILSLLYKLGPERCRMIMIDPKMLELSVYNGIPHLLCPVVTDPQAAVNALNWVVNEMEERYKRMSKLSVRNIDAFNARIKDAERELPEDEAFAHMPYIVVVIDEFADLMMVAGKDVEFAVQRLAQKARAAGIHLIMATQRPSVDVITGTIKANFPTRISFKVASKFDSRTILNEQGAEHLLGQGDMLFWGGNGRSLRVHGPFVSDEEVEAISQFLGKQGKPDYVMGITDGPPSEDEEEADRADVGDDEGGDLYARAVRLVMEDGKASTSYVQRRLGIGYNRAADLIERMEEEGLIGPPGAGGRRPILRDRP